MIRLQIKVRIQIYSEAININITINIYFKLTDIIKWSNYLEGSKII